MKSSLLTSILIYFIFTSVSAQGIDLIIPNGEDNIIADSRFTIRWEGKVYDSLKIEMTLDSSKSWEEISIRSHSEYSVKWNVPDIFSRFCKIRITDINDSTNYDESDNFFTIFPYNFGSSDFISINECLMWIGNNGMSAHDPVTDNAGFFWPGGKEAKITSIYADGILWGGIHNGMVKVNGSTYRYGLTAGKILPNGEADNPYDLKYKIYKIKKNWEKDNNPHQYYLNCRYMPSLKLYQLLQNHPRQIQDHHRSNN